MERKFVEAVIHERGNNFAHDTVSPKLLAEPVAELGGVSMHVFTHSNTNPAGGGAVDLDTKIFF